MQTSATREAYNAKAKVLSCPIFAGNCMAGFTSGFMSCMQMQGPSMVRPELIPLQMPICAVIYDLYT